MKKKNLLLIIFLSLLLFLVSCGKKEGGADNTMSENKKTDKKKISVEEFEKQKNEYLSIATPQELLVKIRGEGDKKGLTQDEYIKLVQTFAYVDVINVGYGKNITLEALSIARKERPLPEYDKKVLDEIFSDPWAQVRAYTFDRISVLTKPTAEVAETVKAAFKNEKEKIAIYKGISALSSLKRYGGKEDEEIVDLIVREVKSDNDDIRRKIAHEFGKEWFKGNQKVKDSLLVLMNDSKKTVAEEACESAGIHNDPKLLEESMKILGDESKAELHSACVSGFVNSWWRGNTNEATYKYTMEYLKKTPRNENVPGWRLVTNIRISSNLENWQDTTSPYFNRKELIEALKDIIKDPDSTRAVRVSAVGTLANHAEKEEYLAFESEIKKITGDGKEEIIKRYNNEIKYRKMK